MASVATLQSIAETLNADCVLLREKLIDNERKAAQYLIRLRADEKVKNTMLSCSDSALGYYRSYSVILPRFYLTILSVLGFHGNQMCRCW